MRVMLDTNIIISAALFLGGQAAKAFYKAQNEPYEAVICDYVVDELRCKFREKFPNRLTELEAFIFRILPIAQLVSTPELPVEAEKEIRDVKDRPILRAALNANADLFLTGDKDFLESSVDDPRIISVREFLEL